jgi:hypothetical protein
MNESLKKLKELFDKYEGTFNEFVDEYNLDNITEGLLRDLILNKRIWG